MNLKKIMCPACGFEFEAELNSDNMCECPNCQQMLLIQQTGIEYDLVTDFEECVTESWQVQQESKNLDDTALEDEVVDAVTVMDFMEGSFAIMTDMEYTGKMSKYSRRLAEGAYLLIHAKKFFGYEH